MADNGQENLWHDTVYSATSALVYALGGPQTVAYKLWPSKDPIASGRYLSNCLDSDRHEKLALDEFIQIIKWGREAGYHHVAKFLADECFYELRVIEPAERKDELRTQVLNMSREMQQLFKQLERLEGS